MSALGGGRRSRTIGLICCVCLGVVSVVALRAQMQPASPPPPCRAPVVGQPVGAYLDWGDRKTLVDGVFVVLRDGIPVVNYPSGAAFNPTTVAQWGLQEFDFMLHGDADGDHKAAVVRAANWLAGQQGPDGAWRYGFEHILADGQVLAPGWTSAIAQGNAISLLVRTAGITGDARYLDVARQALRPLEEPPLRSTLAGGTIFEEHPTVVPQHVLNGFVHTLIGLHDLTGAGDPVAARLYAEGRATVDAHLGRWDNGGAVAYNLTDRHVDVDYGGGVQALLTELEREHPSRTVERWLGRWFPTCASTAVK